MGVSTRGRMLSHTALIACPHIRFCRRRDGSGTGPGPVAKPVCREGRASVGPDDGRTTACTRLFRRARLPGLFPMPFPVR